VSRRTATINQIRALLIEQGIAVRAGAQALSKSLFAISENRKDEISPRMAKLIQGLYEDWCCLDERIETVTGEIEATQPHRAKMSASDERAWDRTTDLDRACRGDRHRRGI
jgi:hypothetical protein